MFHELSDKAIEKLTYVAHGKKCLKCGSAENIEVDHVIPQSMAPELKKNLFNLQPLCKSCNSEKGNTIACYRDKNYSDTISILLNDSYIYCTYFHYKLFLDDFELFTQSKLVVLKKDVILDSIKKINNEDVSSDELFKGIDFACEAGFFNGYRYADDVFSVFLR